MTKEKIKDIINEKSPFDYTQNNVELSFIAIELLEQHEAEMVEFADWLRRERYIKFFVGVDESYFKEDGTPLPTTDLLELYKTRKG